MLDELDDELDWPTEHPTGKKMELLQESLMCPICQDFFTNPQMLKCGHTYCSLCIQRHCDSTLNRTNAGFCPSCREKADPFDMRRNVLIATLVDSYQAVRKDLFDLLHNAIHHKSAPVVEDATSSRSSNGAQSKHRGHPIATRIAHFHLHGASKDKVKKVIEDVTKHSQIKLRTDGDKDVLERRLRELVHLINAQVEAQNALTLDETVAVINQQEKSKEMESRKTKIAQMQGQKAKVDKFAELTQRALASKKRKADGNVEESEGALTKDDIDDSVSLQDVVQEHEWLMHLSPEQFGPWRVVMSSKTRRPFFFNESTKLGQYQMPAELDALRPQPGSSNVVGEVPTAIAAIGSQLPTPNRSSQRGMSSQMELEATLVDIPEVESTLVDPTSTATRASHQESETDLFDLSQHMRPAEIHVMPAPDNSDDLFTLGIIPTNQQPHDEVRIVDEVRHINNGDKGTSKATAWSCGFCTFLNPKMTNKCSMCDSENPSYFNLSSKPSRRSMRNTPFNFNDPSTQATLPASSRATQSVLGFGSPTPSTHVASKKSKR